LDTLYAKSFSHLENFSADSVLIFYWKWQKLLVGMWQTFGFENTVERKGAQLTEVSDPLLCFAVCYSATSGTRKIVAD
jgi:hypothetical protein